MPNFRKLIRNRKILRNTSWVLIGFLVMFVGYTFFGLISERVAQASSPTISNISPNNGSVNGGTNITITGTNFIELIENYGDGGAGGDFGSGPYGGGQSIEVYVNNNLCTNLNFVSSTELTCDTPAGSIGLADVKVVNPNGSEVILTDGFEYLELTIDSITPNQVPLAGGTSVSINGSGFSEEISVPITTTLDDGNDTNTVLLIESDTTDGSTTFTDTSQGGTTHTITANGNVQHDTADKRFGNSSIKFDGDGDYLTIPDSEDFNFGSGDFTVETWVNTDTVTGNADIIGHRGSGGYGPFLIYRLEGNYVFYSSSNGTSWDVGTSWLGSVTVNKWMHLAVTRQGNTFRMYKDGSQISTFTSSATLFNGNNPLIIGSDNGVSFFQGHLDQIRITKGEAKYTSKFTPQNHPYNNPLTNHNTYITVDTQTLISNSKLQSDCRDLRIYDSTNTTELPYYIETGTCNTTSTKVWFTAPTLNDGNNTFYLRYGNSNLVDNQDPTVNPYADALTNANTKLFLESSTTNGSTTFTDTSSGGTTHSITANGNVQHDTADKRFGNSSIKFDGDGDYLTIPDSEDFNFGSGDFSIDFWINVSDISNQSVILGHREGNYGPFFVWRNGANIYFYASSNGTSWDIAAFRSMGSVQQNKWTHLAVTRQGNTFKLFNSTNLVYSFTSSSTLINVSTPLSIGAYYFNGANSYNGYLDNVRITKGEALYTSFFQAPGADQSDYLNSTIDFDSETSLGVTIDGNTCTNLVVVSATQITCDTPYVSSPRTVDVVVTQASYTDTLVNGFEYVSANISSITPNQVPLAGGTSVSIGGTGFDTRKQKEIVLNNPNVSTINNAEVLIEINTKELVDNGNLQSNCSDLRFYDSDNSTEINYYLESGCNTTQTLIWVKIPAVTSGNYSIYLKYGLTGVNSQSDINNFSFSSILNDANLKLHLDADSGTLLNDSLNPVSNGEGLESWSDVSGNNITTTQTTTDQQPIYNTDIIGLTDNFNKRSAVQFDGINDWMQTSLPAVTGNNARSYFFVGDFVYQNLAYEHILHSGTAAGGQSHGLTYKDASGVALGNHYWFGQYNTGTNVTGSPTAVGLTYNGSVETYYQNNSQIGTNTINLTTGSTQGYTIFSRISSPAEVGKGYLSKAMIFDRSLSPAEVTTLNNYLNQKYFLANTSSLIRVSSIGAENESQSITIGGNICTNLVVVSATQITCDTPAGNATGLVDVVVSHVSGATHSLLNGFEYIAATINSITPNRGSLIGGDTVTIDGNGFDQSKQTEIILNNPNGSTINNAEILIELNTQQLINNTLLNSNCSDLRFYDSTNELDYYIESGCNTTQTLIWVKIPAVTSGQYPIYARYGIPTLQSESNINNFSFSSILADPALEMHLDADSSSLLNDTLNPISSGETVESWSDLTSNGITTTQTTTDQQPIFYNDILGLDDNFNKRSAVQFDGLNDWMQTNLGAISSNNPRSYFFVGDFDTMTSSYSHILHSGTASGGQSHGLLHRVPFTNTLSNHYWSSHYNTNYDISGSATAVGLTYDGSVERYYADNSEVGTNNITLNTGTAQDYTIFSRISAPSEVGKGYLSKAMVFSKQLSLSEVNTLNNYLNQKYFLYNTSNLIRVQSIGSTELANMVKINGNKCQNVTYVSSTQLTCETPSAASAGFVNVLVNDFYNATDTLVAGFEYFSMSVSSISPSSGLEAGGNTITFTGEGFGAGKKQNITTNLGNNNSNTVLLLESDNADGSTTFTDTSNGGTTHTITPNGDVQHDITEKKFRNSSIQFDGTGDYLTMPDSEDWNFGSGDFTIDMWVRPDSIDGGSDILAQRNNDIYSPFTVSRIWGSYYFYASSNQTSWDISGFGEPIGAAVVGQWSHIAISREGNTLRMFYNGKLTQSVTTTATLYNSSLPMSVGAQSDGRSYFNGRLDQIRVIKGEAKYTSNFAPLDYPYGDSITNHDTYINIDTAALISASKLQSDCRDLRIYDSTNTSQLAYYIETGTCNTANTKVWFTAPTLNDGNNTFYLRYGNPALTDNQTASVNPYADALTNTNTKLFINADGGSIEDDSLSNKNITINGNANINNATPVSGNGSLNFDGVGDNLQLTIDNDFEFGTGDYTVDSWVYVDSTGNGGSLFEIGSWGNTILLRFDNKNTLCFYRNGTGNCVNVGNIENTWIHVALVRISGQTKLYVNGLEYLSVADTTNYVIGYYGQNLIKIGASVHTGGNDFKGRMDNFRIIKGQGLYANTFEPPSSTQSTYLDSSINPAESTALAATFGGNTCTNVTYISSTQFSCVNPAGTAGFVDVVAYNTSGNTDLIVNGFQYMGVVSDITNTDIDNISCDSPVVKGTSTNCVITLGAGLDFNNFTPGNSIQIRLQGLAETGCVIPASGNSMNCNSITVSNTAQSLPIEWKTNTEVSYQTGDTIHIINNINTTNLNLYYDAEHTGSYSGSGQDIIDLAGGNNATLGLNNSANNDDPSYNASGPKSFKLDGIDDFIETGLPSNFSTDFTLESWVKRNDSLPVSSGLRVHLDAANIDVNDTTNEVRDVGASIFIKSWDDQSGNANHAIQATDTNQPKYKVGSLGGYPTVLFDGADDFLDLSSSTYQDIFVVAKKYSGNTNGAILNNGSTKALSHNALGDANDFATSYTVNRVAESGTFAGTYLDQFTLTYGNVSGGATSALSLGEGDGSFDYLDGEIAEVIIFDTTLSTAERQQVECYLAIKYQMVNGNLSVDCTDNQQRIATLYRTAQTESRIAFGLNNSTIQTEMFDGTGSLNSDSGFYLGDRWQHVVTTYDSTANEVKQYINGVLITTENLGSQGFNLAAGSSGNIRLGAFGNTPGSANFNGEIGLFRTYSSALSQANIQANFDIEKSRFGFNNTSLDFDLALDAKFNSLDVVVGPNQNSFLSIDPLIFEDRINSRANYSITVSMTDLVNTLDPTKILTAESFVFNPNLSNIEIASGKNQNFSSGNTQNFTDAEVNQTVLTRTSDNGGGLFVLRPEVSLNINTVQLRAGDYTGSITFTFLAQ